MAPTSCSACLLLGQPLRDHREHRRVTLGVELRHRGDVAQPGASSAACVATAVVASETTTIGEPFAPGPNPELTRS
jgi:hypothetical protein